MENTLENKAKFFALFMVEGQGFTLKQEAYYDESGPEKSMGTAIKPKGFSFTFDWQVTSNAFRYNGGSFPFKFIQRSAVELKPLSAISDEDALQVAKFEFPTTPGFQNVEDGRLCTVHEDVQSELSQPSVDYLRLKGYAVPFLDLSVKSQISYGWVKLAEVC